MKRTRSFDVKKAGMEQGFRMKEREKKAEKERKTAHGAVNRTGQDMKPPGHL